MAEAVDWGRARVWAGRLARSGKPPKDLAAAVRDIRAATERAGVLAADVSGLRPSVAPARVLVVDRASWARANLTTFETLLEPVLAPVSAAAPSRIGAAELSAGLAMLSSRVVGQFDPFASHLLMVAPNVLAIERASAFRPRDFRLWVGIHEQTHALQFGTAPWLADELTAAMRELIGGLVERTKDPSKLLGRPPAGSDTQMAPRLLLGALGPEHAATLERVTGIMALLEGHADVVMDDVGPRHIPTVAHLRATFEKRRDSNSSLAAWVMRRVMGLDAKLAQYRKGAAFVRDVRDRAGADGFARVWEGPHAMPTWDEIVDPPRWIARVLSQS